jgi:hypothetical protein
MIRADFSLSAYIKPKIFFLASSIFIASLPYRT